MNRHDVSLDLMTSPMLSPTSKEKVALTAFAVSAVDRSGNESELIIKTLGL